MTSKIFINFLFPENITVTTALERDGFLERFCVCGVRANPSTIIDHSTSINEFPPALIDHSTNISENRKRQSIPPLGLIGANRNSELTANESTLLQEIRNCRKRIAYMVEKYSKAKQRFEEAQDYLSASKFKDLSPEGQRFISCQLSNASW